ncbi:hypothetical protein SAMN04489835_4776 [Mycolicibacterium rutilum]|uniref:DUF1622 domain-containing protein n=1 Tax=Mycolicibacterium rutilum TaxID=370526 RepID=A0A1H6L7I5_MYCRU|nr:hypothetical protein [Mycolicibacterium rutilum]SEH84217.1 hypothetical protein SAMN04489835_4776 [Mycolicibacterium rutilum]
MIGLDDLSWVIAAAGIVLAALTVVVLRRPQLALHVLLDLLLAAGLLRLSADASWRSIAVTAIVIAVRHLLTRGLRPVTPGGVRVRWPTPP